MATRHNTAAPPAKEGSAAPGRPPADAVPPEVAKKRARLSRRWQRDIRWSPYVFVSPFFLLFLAFGLFPLLYTAWASLHTVELTAPTDMEWAGLRNYTRIFDDEFDWNAARNTLTIGIISTVPQLLMALGLAHILNYKLRASTFYRVMMLAPYATSEPHQRIDHERRDGEAEEGEPHVVVHEETGEANQGYRFACEIAERL